MCLRQAVGQLLPIAGRVMDVLLPGFAAQALNPPAVCVGAATVGPVTSIGLLDFSKIFSANKLSSLQIATTPPILGTCLFLQCICFCSLKHATKHCSSSRGSSPATRAGANMQTEAHHFALLCASEEASYRHSQTVPGETAAATEMWTAVSSKEGRSIWIGTQLLLPWAHA